MPRGAIFSSAATQRLTTLCDWWFELRSPGLPGHRWLLDPPAGSPVEGAGSDPGGVLAFSGPVESVPGRELRGWTRVRTAKTTSISFTSYITYNAVAGPLLPDLCGDETTNFPDLRSPGPTRLRRWAAHKLSPGHLTSCYGISGRRLSGSPSPGNARPRRLPRRAAQGSPGYNVGVHQSARVPFEIITDTSIARYLPHDPFA